MPIVGRNKRAKPAHVYKAMNLSTSCKPGVSETFDAYSKRLDSFSDPLLVCLTDLGYGEPTRREYLRRLEELHEDIYLLRNALDKAWPK